MSTAQKASAAIATLKPVSAARSEATKTEQSRAIAEVQSMVVVARANPRNEGQCRLSMQASCGQRGLAERAFFKFPRGGGTVTGETIHLAVDLARCWGNVDYGIKELSRDDDARQSEMMAYAWDLQTNARSASTFIVPHRRDKGEGGGDLTSMRDIYENNANMGARRLREMIFRILPPWFLEEAADACRKTLTEGDGSSPAERKTKMMDAFAALGISVARLEAKVGAKVALWTPVDLAQLRISYGSVSRKEVTADEEFPTVTSEAAASAIATPVETPKVEPETPKSADASSVADASGEAVAASQSPTSPEAPALDFGAPASFDVEKEAEAILHAIEQFKTVKAIDNYLSTVADALERIGEEYEPTLTMINQRVAARKKALAGGAK